MEASTSQHTHDPPPDRGRGRGSRGRGRRRNRRHAAADRGQHSGARETRRLQSRRPEETVMGSGARQEGFLRVEDAGSHSEAFGEEVGNQNGNCGAIGGRHRWEETAMGGGGGHRVGYGGGYSRMQIGQRGRAMGTQRGGAARGLGRERRRGGERVGRGRVGGERRGNDMAKGRGTAAATELSERLATQMARGDVECVVCLERVRRGAPTWNCGRCFVITHLHCARKWANAGVEGDGVMYCPSCRAAQGSVKEVNYRCFCGKRKNPVLEPGVLPGSCGDPCQKGKGEEGSGCPHKCNALCHPGPCAPCIVQAPGRRCLCGRETVFRRCGEVIELEKLRCGRVCGRVRECGHECPSVCHDHDAEGSECEVVVNVSCFCGRAEEKLPCGVGRMGFACGKICGKLLKCGEHHCEMPCHDGPCAECVTAVDVVKTCACGKEVITERQRRARSSCLDPLPSCGDICGKELECLKRHTCTKICGHEGICGPCEEVVFVECRCAASTVQVDCGGDKEELKKRLICDRRCNEFLLCRRHRCKNVCCMYKKRKAFPKPNVLSSDAVWLDPLAGVRLHGMSNADRRRLGHVCQETCEELLSCGLHKCDFSCGHSGDCPPCGILSREPLFCACNSVSIPPPVRCGTMPPTCGKPCSKERNCGHRCPDECHPGECAPCVENTKFDCVGGHGESRFVPCHIGTKGIKCSRACGKPLLCGIHACRNQCHGDFPRKCEFSTVDGCSQICGMPRRTCDHTCLGTCHPGMICPNVPCQHIITVSCPCGRRQEQAKCLRGGDGGAQKSGDSIRLACDDECTAQARLRAFATAVGKEGLSNGANIIAGVEESGGDSAKYGDFLLHFAEREPRILAYFEQEFAKIVQGKAKKLVLEELPQLHRLVVHTMADYYMLDSESSGRVPHRKLVVRHRGVGVKPKFPKPLLSEALTHREKERKRQESGKALVIHVAGSTKYSAGVGIEGRVGSELRAHAGAYRIVGKTTMSSNLTGVTVEFSTPERALLVRNTLLARPGVTVEKPIVHTTTSTSRRAVALSDIAESSSWNEGTEYTDRGLRNGLPPPPPLPIDTDSTNVPDSWDD